MTPRNLNNEHKKKKPHKNHRRSIGKGRNHLARTGVLGPWEGWGIEGYSKGRKEK